MCKWEESGLEDQFKQGESGIKDCVSGLGFCRVKSRIVKVDCWQSGLDGGSTQG